MILLPGEITASPELLHPLIEDISLLHGALSPSQHATNDSLFTVCAAEDRLLRQLTGQAYHAVHRDISDAACGYQMVVMCRR